MKNNTNIKKPSNQGKEMKTDYSKGIILGLIIIIIVLVGITAFLIYKGNHPKLSDGKQVVASIDGKDFTA